MRQASRPRSGGAAVAPRDSTSTSRRSDDEPRGLGGTLTCALASGPSHQRRNDIPPRHGGPANHSSGPPPNQPNHQALSSGTARGRRSSGQASNSTGNTSDGTDTLGRVLV
jgi:hypothetical protein